MFPADHDTYKTCVHEALHALRAIATGHKVKSITIHVGESLINVAETLLEWGLFPWETRTLLRTDTEYVTALVKGVIGTCLAPALQEHTPPNARDEAAYQLFMASWPRTAPITWGQLHKQAVAETNAWLAKPETRRQVRQIAERLFVHRGGEIAGALLQQILARVTEQHAPPPAPPVRLAPAAPARPARPARPAITGLDIQVQWCFDDLERLQRSTQHAHQSQRHNWGRYGAQFLAA